MSTANAAQAFEKRIYYFGKTRTDGVGVGKERLGGKGANLAEMTSLGIPVPPGFTIATHVCADYNNSGKKLPNGLMEEVREHVALLESELGKEFGGENKPLLVSVRSGAADSMPGMMDAVLNLGLNDNVVLALTNVTNNQRFAYDAYRRLIREFGQIVMSVEVGRFERALDEIKCKYNVTENSDVPTAGMVELCAAFKTIYANQTGEEFPQDPYEQLEKAIGAMLSAWNMPRAVRYREVESAQYLRGLIGTAVNVQSMVYGNMGDDSAIGIAVSRNPSNGKNELYGEYVVNAQGEDVVTGIRTPQPVAEMSDWNADAHQQLMKLTANLESHYKAVQDINFTVENGQVFVLQSRTISGLLLPEAAVRIVVEMVKEGLIDEESAVFRVDRQQVDELLTPCFDRRHNRDCICRGLPASNGVAVGRIAFTARESRQRAESGEDVVLVIREVERRDINGLHAAKGVLTTLSGATSNAAVISRRWGKPAVTGATAVEIDLATRTLRVGGTNLTSRDWISLDGNTGEVFAGQMPIVDTAPEGPLKEYLEWESIYRPRNRPPSPYCGDEPFAFVSYSHQDKEAVFEEMTRLSGQGFRLWFDAGITPSSQWKEKIVDALERCSVIVAFLSPRSANSKQVKKEISYASEYNTLILPVVIEACDLPPEVRFDLHGTQMIMKYELAEEDYHQRLDEKLRSLKTARS